MPASSRSATPPSSASAPTPPASSPSTAIGRPAARPGRRGRSPPRCSASSTSFLVLRGTDLTRLMVTLGVALVLREIANRCLAHRRRRRPAGHRDGADARPVRVRPLRPHRLLPTASPCCSCCSCSRGASCIRPSACRCARSRTIRCARAAIGIAGQRAAGRGLHARRRLCRRRRRAAGADHAVRLARRARLPPLGRRAAGAGHRRRRLSLRRPRSAPSSFKLLQDCLVGIDAAILAVLDRPRSWSSSCWSAASGIVGDALACCGRSAAAPARAASAGDDASVARDASAS